MVAKNNRRNIILACQRGGGGKIISHSEIEELFISDTLINHDKMLYLAIDVFGNSVCCTKTEVI